MFTPEKIEKLVSLYENINKVKEDVRREYSSALEQSKDVEYTMVKKDKEVSVKGSDLWYEVQNLGAECEAGKFLAPLFPAVFESSKIYDSLVDELNKFSKAELGIDPLAMTLLDIVKIAQGVVEMSKKD